MKTMFSSIAVALTLGACASVGPDYAPPPTAPVNFTNATGTGLTPEQIETRWWQRFADPTLDRLVERALAANHDLRIAAARLKEARAISRDVELDRLPTVTASADAVRGRQSEVEARGADRDLERYRLGFDAAWELDLFGRVRRGIEAARAEAEGAAAGVRDARVSVIAEVARNYFEWRGAQLQLTVAERNLANQRETLRLTELRLAAGRGTALDTARASAQLNATAAVIPLYEIATKQAEHRLAVLIGARPGDFTLAAPATLAPLTASFPIGKPEELLRRRPDIRMAERALAASTARVGVATAELFPRLSVTGFLGFAAAGSGDLGGSGSRTWLAAPALSWAAFDLGSVRARLRASEARAEAALAYYEQTVLRALEETENAFVQFGREQARVQHLRAAAAAAAQATELARIRYREGVADFLALLDAERTQLEADSRVAQGEARAYTALVAVYKALGGGWELCAPDCTGRESSPTLAKQ